MLLKGDPWDTGVTHEFVMYCPKCNERQCSDSVNTLEEMKKMRCPKCSTPLVDIDDEMIDIIIKLNKEYTIDGMKLRPFETVQCCAGHWLSIYTNSIPYISLRVSKLVMVPFALLSTLTTADIGYDIDMSKFDDNNQVKYIAAVNGDGSLPPERLLTIRMNTDNIISSLEDEREFPGYSEKCFDRRKKIFLKQLESFAFMCFDLGAIDTVRFVKSDNSDNIGVIEKYLNEHNMTLEEALKKKNS